MNINFVKIVPAQEFLTDKEVLRDCAVATSLLHKIMIETPSLTPDEAFSHLQKMLSRVCIFGWDRMQFVRPTH